ncbi:Predicted oxidoreductase, contains short-chain dehydrogenase (SDR) and DUF2520 domains [Micromonospora pattaloongensis]|uniref:Predicted oxidoreductase, contains short-chain dehydrogenase (SDR) and DUF2520 domains n=1 Tax=Micromonospora pattaloongensis TaxID=405436 RepID=A0A1H3H8D5_9ACTN|nr:Rossmann-like and DUF2520 domain-containing protein [Micromonospora pattaloongensis]SDY11766.1 Predicted oxidoreductase, contains short-chain dehydrogenase (SDR) and DUF2520 domains [Micromonospora pattaloongensis]
MSASPRQRPGHAPAIPAQAPAGSGGRADSSSLTVGVIGAGRVGAVLGAALARAGHHVAAASGVSAAAKARIARLLPGAANLPADEVARAAADLLIVAVPDDALAAVIAGLAETGALRAGQVVAHTSGAHGLAVLAPAVAAGARPLALHPAMTFTGEPADLDRLAGISYGLTAPPPLRPLAERLVAELGGSPEWVAEADRPLYHAALAHGANHLVTLVNEALDRLGDAGVRHPEKVLGPLVRAALENTLRLGDAALTGPVSRGDAGTVARHLDRLAGTAPESVPTYVALARRTADRAIAAGRLRPADAESLLDVLATDAAPAEREAAA